MVGKTALNKERYHLNGGPFQTIMFRSMDRLHFRLYNRKSLRQPLPAIIRSTSGDRESMKSSTLQPSRICFCKSIAFVVLIAVVDQGLSMSLLSESARKSSSVRHR